MARMRWMCRLIASIALAIATLFCALGMTFLGAETVRATTKHDGLPDVHLRPLAQRSEIVAADGSLLSALYEEDRQPVPSTRCRRCSSTPSCPSRTDAFYEHEGVNVRALVRAAKRNATSGAVEEGGSTITQQLVKNSVLTSDRSYDRKAKEAVLAFRMEHELTKDQILETYLNTVYFGEGAYGVRAAATRYFAKPLEQLTLPEAALLAGMISSPQRFDPVQHADAASARRGHVLRRMVKAGAITQAQADEPARRPCRRRSCGTIRSRRTTSPRRSAGQLLSDERLGATPEERSTLVFRGGVRVETTLDPALQASAEQAVRDKLPQSPFTAALVAIDPGTGDVKALVGGPNFADAKYNLATQGSRQAGSSFKTIALAAWIASGRSPEDLVDATAPCEFPTPGTPEPVWHVDNYEGSNGPEVTTLREATVKSLNSAYARLSLTLGPEKLVEMAHKLGISHDIPNVPSIVLGSAEVSPLEMASVYATLAADGIRRPPVFIRRVLGPDGRVLLENNPAEDACSSRRSCGRSPTCFAASSSGTARKANIGRPVAGKTGTAQLWRDAWFSGYTPQLATSVWMGSPTGQESMTDVGGIHVTGGSYPAQIWAQFMGAAMAPLPVKDFDPVDPAWWPPNQWIGTAPAVLPPGFVLPPHLQPLPPGLMIDPATGLPVAAPPPPPPPPPVLPTPPTTAAPAPTTTTTAKPQPTTTTTTARPTTTTTQKRPKH